MDTAAQQMDKAIMEADKIIEARKIQVIDDCDGLIEDTETLPTPVSQSRIFDTVGFGRRGSTQIYMDPHDWEQQVKETDFVNLRAKPEWKSPQACVECGAGDLDQMLPDYPDLFECSECSHPNDGVEAKTNS